MLRRDCLAALFGVGASLGVGAAHGATAMLQVAATIRRQASIRITRIPATFTITEEDLASGWSRAQEPVLLQVRTNHDDGFVLQIGPLLDTVAAAEMTGFERRVTIGPGGSAVALPAGRGLAQVELGFRFQLAPGLQPGRHPWPLELSAAA